MVSPFNALIVKLFNCLIVSSELNHFAAFDFFSINRETDDRPHLLPTLLPCSAGIYVQAV